MSVEKKAITKQGTVVGTAMQKTAVVTVTRTYQHPLYRKVMKNVKKYKVHDPKEEARVGDVVEIREIRPVSKTKSWILSQIIRTSDLVEDVDVNKQENVE